MESMKIIIIICIILLHPGLANAAALNAGQGQIYSTIQSAIDAAKTGDIISVAEGTYFENLEVKKNGILIIGKNKKKTIIDGKNTGSVIKIDAAHNVQVSGLTIRNSGGSGQYDGGISIYSANNNLISNLILINNIMGISISSGSSNNVISGNEIKYSSKYGIFIVSSNDNRISNNNILNNMIGIYADSARTNHIYSNNFIENNDQAFDNSGMNSWDDGRTGNYWDVNNGILGGKNAKDNFPLAEAVQIKEEEVPASSGQNPEAETGKVSPGFGSNAVLISLVLIWISGIKRR